LLGAVVAIGSEKFFRAYQTQCVEVIRRHHVGSAFTTIERQQRDAAALTARLVCENAAVFVVGMSRNHYKAGACVEFLQALPERRRAAIKCQRLRLSVRLRRASGSRLRFCIRDSQDKRERACRRKKNDVEQVFGPGDHGFSFRFSEYRTRIPALRYHL
jgi:hypothetical protein